MTLMLGRSVAKGRHIPVRRCVVCGQRFPKRILIRFVRTVDGSVEVDPTSKKAGRGAYLCSSEDCWVKGLRKDRLGHALRSTLTDKAKEGFMAYHQEQLKSAVIGEVR